MTDHRHRTYEAMAAFMAELAGGGVSDVVVSPGSRSTPLTLTADATPGLRTWIQIDERSAGFFALGLAKSTRRPVALVCTSGTAAANYLPAVAEAYYSATPLIVLTADRPPELRGWGAGQTIDQVHLYGRHTRWFAELPVGDALDEPVARRSARRAVALASGTAPGPVHLNVPFREPLEPPDDGVPTAVAGRAVPAGAVEQTLSPAELDRLAGLVEARPRGVIAAGPRDLDAGSVAAIARLSTAAGWPILADAASQLRRGPHVAECPVIATADHLLRTPFAENRPDVVLRVGATPTSKAMRLWLEQHRPAEVVVLDPLGQWNEPSFTSTAVLPVDARALADPLADTLGGSGRTSDWLHSWSAADQAAGQAIDAVLDAAPLLEAGIARTVGDACPEATVVYASNSMPVRDLDGFLRPGTARLRVLVNRGANGIDGVTSSALGAAARSAVPVVALVGDLAVLHDLGGLLAAGRLGLDLTLIVPNNDGGGIFSFLPIAERSDAIDTHRLFHTPHGIDLSALAPLARLRHQRLHERDELAAAVAAAVEAPGVDLIEVPIDPQANVRQHREVLAAVAVAVG